MVDLRTHYDVIGVSENATQATIRATYLRLIKIYHPDHNSDPTAGRRTAEIIEAYSVLSDEHARTEYDATLHPSNVSGATSKSYASEPQVVPIVVCKKCGRQSASLRITLMYWVVSFVVVTRRGGRSGILCEKCRAKQSAIWSVLTGFLGWWGFPWGPIYTIQALYHNAIGGNLDKKQNAALLRIVAYQLYEKGKFQEALRAVDASIELEHDTATSRFADSLRILPGSFYPRVFPIFRLLSAIPSVAVSIAFFALIYHWADQPSGYAARYTGTNASQNVAAPTIPKSSRGRNRVNDLVDELGTEVYAHATPAGSHREGTSTVNDYELDRSKYQPAPFIRIAAQISPYLGDAVADGDGFSASAFFNASLMGLSVSILNGFSNGQDITEDVNKVFALSEDERIRSWLTRSKYNEPYRSLVSLLKSAVREQSLGVSSQERRAMLKSYEGEIDNSEVRIDEARRQNEHYVEKGWIQKHNRTASLYNDLLTKERRNHLLYQKVDFAFNKCLDPSVLMSKFQQVNLTHGEAAVSALPDN